MTKCANVLITILRTKQENEQLRISCAHAIGRIGDNDGRAELLRVFKSRREKKNLRRACLDGLERGGLEPYGNLLFDILESNDSMEIQADLMRMLFEFKPAWD